MNPTVFEDGRNAVIEELKCLAPDAQEAMARYEQLEEALTQHTRELVAAISAARIALGAINVDLQLLREETRGNSAELERRLKAIDLGVERLGYPYAVPTLRVVVPLNGSDVPA